MKKIIVSFFCIGLVFATSACQNVTIRDKGLRRLASEPTYEESKPFYLGGLVGSHRVDVRKICGNRNVLQMQSQRTFLDGFLDVITFTIYAPHTVRVWCDDNQGGA